MTTHDTMARRHTAAHENGHGADGMILLARDMQRFHDRSMPEARVPSLNAFPSGSMRGLWLGVLLGGLAGLIFSLLMNSGVLTIGGSEGLFSASTMTFHMFWIFKGIAIGIVASSAAIVSAEDDEQGHQNASRSEERTA